jgi:serine/threonine protein kinase
LIMQYAKDGSLNDLIYKQKAKLKQGTILAYAHDIASGLAYLHGRNAIHRDLKSANILVSSRGCNVACF